ncbi:MAG: PfkB family carbohydrate kinase [Chitinophagales bacterium]|nr:PfkB family carbohydrate kinase [Chitinophagales bacterium]
MQVLVVGDIILDKYKSGVIDRISPEAPVPVIIRASNSYATGGAANVAVNLSSLGISTTLAGVVGQDGDAELIKNILNDYQVNYLNIISQQSPTISKTRILGNGKHIARIDIEESFEQEADFLFEKVKNLSPDYLVLSDYNKGSLKDIQKYILHFQSKGIKILIDPKRDISLYRGAWLIKPNRNEFVKYIGNFNSYEELVGKGRQCIIDNHIEHMVVTLGAEGIMYIHRDTHHFYPAHLQQVVDITGAGDTILVGLVYGISKGYDMSQSIQIAKQLAEYSVTQLGTYVIKPSDLSKFIF